MTLVVFLMIVLSNVSSTVSYQVRALSTKVIPEAIWREEASKHAARVHELLRPGLKKDSLALDPKHPIYNFFIEYYGMKGSKGLRKLKLWTPSTFPVCLEGAGGEDLGHTLSPRGASLDSHGVVYSPSSFYRGLKDPESSAASFLWYHSVLRKSIQREPVLHCYNLHEWAMQYWPAGSEPPPSSKYQKHLPLRVDQTTLNDTVEQNSVCCTHYDALRFFAPSALPLNSIPLNDRGQQLRDEQPACLHATMDLFKIAYKLRPFIPADLMFDCLTVAVKARELDVAASPYDASSYGVRPIMIEDSTGRSEYKTRQLRLLKESKPTREALLSAFEDFIAGAFDETCVSRAKERIPVIP